MQIKMIYLKSQEKKRELRGQIDQTKVNNYVTSNILIIRRILF